jgi:hypothetical protein
MNLSRTFAAGLALIVSPLIFGQQSLAETKCVPLLDGVEYRAFLPDAKRFIYVDVKVLPGAFPSVFVIIDKNYEAPSVKLAANSPWNSWWIDRSRPMAFSTDRVRIRWKEHHTFDFVIDWFAEKSPKEFVQTIRGLDKVGDHFEGTGATDTNTFAFQSRIEMSGFGGDYFEVSVPAVSYEGVTVTPPIVRFERQDDSIVAKC